MDRVKLLLYFFSGFLFSVGLSLSGMNDPAKVRGFLSVGFPDWNPALLFVLGSAVLVYALAYSFLKRGARTWDGRSFTEPVGGAIDARLLLGAAIFGIGWGLVGLCPGPALVLASLGNGSVTVFLVTLFLGFELQRLISKTEARV